MDRDDVSRMGQRSTGVYTIYPAGSLTGFPVRCDMASDGGGWTVIQRRVNGSTDFQQTWYNYQMGFESPGHEYWLGNELIHIMTTQFPYQLRIDMVSNGKEEFVTYSNFNISDAHDGYRLFVDGFSMSSDLKDGLSSRHNHMKFSTVDNDQDADDDKNCATDRNGGWWFKNCNNAFLNGGYGTTGWPVIYWTNISTQLQFVEMKIRKLTDV